MNLEFMGIVDRTSDEEIHANALQSQVDRHLAIAKRDSQETGYYKVIGMEDRLTEFRIQKFMGGYCITASDKKGSWNAGRFESYKDAFMYVVNHYIEGRDVQITTDTE